MKKRIVFYIGWDVLFVIYIYLYSAIGIRIREYSSKTFDNLPIVFLQPLLLIIAGAIIGWLIFVSNRYQFTIKQALLELVIIGIPALYLATILATPYLICLVTGYQEIRYYTPLMLSNSTTPIIIGSIVFGYELFIFMIRIIKCKQVKKIPAPPSE